MLKKAPINAAFLSSTFCKNRKIKREASAPKIALGSRSVKVEDPKILARILPTKKSSGGCLPQEKAMLVTLSKGKL